MVLQLRKTSIFYSEEGKEENREENLFSSQSLLTDTGTKSHRGNTAGPCEFIPLLALDLLLCSSIP